MKTQARIIGALLTAVVGGCAGTKSTVIPIQPLAEGTPVGASSYELVVDGQPGGRVMLTQGQAVLDQHGKEIIHVGLAIDNRSPQAYRMPTDRIFLSRDHGQEATLVRVDGQTTPSVIDVQPGASRNINLAFVPVAPIGRRELGDVQVHWTLLVDGSSQPITRGTTFTAVRTGTRTAAR
jgi:hypothetical protein